MLKVKTSRNKLCRRLLILVLLMIMMTGSASAGISDVSAKSFSTEKMNIYVRAFVPGKDTPWKSIGHYDLMIEGRVTFRGKTFKNPVFSYRSEDSCLAVFNEADTGKYYAHSSPGDYYYDCDLYQCCFTTADYSTVKDFLKQLNSIISSSAKYSGGVKCSFKRRSEFSRYKVSSINCFYAVAVWLKGFGNDSLMDYYHGAHSGKYSVYLPENLIDVFGNKFKLKYAG